MIDSVTLTNKSVFANFGLGWNNIYVTTFLPRLQNIYNFAVVYCLPISPSCHAASHQTLKWSGTWETSNHILYYCPLQHLSTPVVAINSLSRLLNNAVYLVRELLVDPSDNCEQSSCKKHPSSRQRLISMVIDASFPFPCQQPSHYVDNK